jgi:hypothetical protein
MNLLWIIDILTQALWMNIGGVTKKGILLEPIII